MAELQGTAAKAAYKHAAVWGAAETLGDGDQVEYATENIVPDVQLVESDQINGEALSGPSDTGQVLVQGDLAGMDLKYEGHERFIYDVFGTKATSGGGGVIQHKFDFGLSNEGRFGTLAFEKVVTGPHEIDSFKPMGLTIVGAAGQPVKLTIRGIGRQLRTKDPDRTNDSSTTWTLPGNGSAEVARRLVKFGHATIEIAVPVIPVAAFGTLTYTETPFTAAAVVVVGVRTYTFRAAVTVDWDVKLGATTDATMQNLVNAINMSGGTNGVAGDYLVPSANADVSAALNAVSNVATVTARVAGTAGNTIVLTTTEAEITLAPADGSLDGGVAGSVSFSPLCASGFTLSFQRNGDPVPTTCDGDYTSEPSTDTVEITGSFDFPIYDNDNDFLVDANIAKTVLVARITFDSGVDLGAGPDNYRHVIWLPAFQLTGGYPNVSGKGRVPLTATFRVVNATTVVDTDATMPRWYVHSSVADPDDYTNS